MKVNLNKLIESLSYLLKVQKWDAEVSADFEKGQIQVDWKVPNKKFFKRLDKEFSWWSRKHETVCWQHVRLSDNYTKGTTVFSFDEDEVFGEDEIFDEELKAKIDESMKTLDEVMEHQTIHPMGSGISLNKEVEASFQILPQIPFSSSKVQFITKTDFGVVSVPLKYKSRNINISTKLMKYAKASTEEIAKKLWSDLEFATLFKRSKPFIHNKKYKDLRRIDLTFEWECPSVLTMQLVEKIIEDAIEPYGLIIVGEIHG